MFKTLERVVLRHLEATTLADHPLNEAQHAFRVGRGTDSALSNMVGYIETAFQANQKALAVFLDIQGAFDNVRPSKILEGFDRIGVPRIISRWFQHYIDNRYITVEYQGIGLKRTLTRGTPQGGILSPLVWNLCFDTLLQKFQDGWIKIVGFADDGALITWGTNPKVLVQRMQEALEKVTEWGQDQGLTFSTAKTVAMVCHRSRNQGDFPPLTLYGEELPYKQQVKYLGILVDCRLNWHAHVRWKIGIAKSLLMKIRNATGKLWGLPPKQGRWAYIGVVHPALTYGAIVWAKASTNPHLRRRLSSLNRLALMTWTLPAQHSHGRAGSAIPRTPTGHQDPDGSSGVLP